jgi:hypothetical protein
MTLLERAKLLIERLSADKSNLALYPAKEPLLRHREPNPDELALGWAWGMEEKENREVWQLKGIKQEHRDTHFYIIGGSGTGKTKFIETLIQQDIKNKAGFGIIDPHGDLVEDIKGYLCLSEPGQSEKFLRENVILIDPTDPKKTVCFNPLEKIPGITAAEQAGELVGVFKKIWQDSWGARMEDLLRNSLIALTENEMTLVELPPFLSDNVFREKILEKVKHPICRQYFQRFNSLRQGLRDEWAESTLNKVNAFLSHDLIRQVFVSVKSSFNLREIMDNKKILLVKLDRGRLKESGELLGSLLLSKIQMAAFSRTDMPESERVPFYLYIDEFQNFATENFIETLSEARKYRFSLVLAHQNLAQLPMKLQASIMANCSIQSYFRISRSDASVLAKEALTSIYTQPPGWEAYIQHLQDLPPRVCAVKNRIDGGVIMIGAIDSPPAWKMAGQIEKEFKEFVAAKEIGAKYLRDRGEVEKEYQERKGKFTAEEKEEADKETFREPKKF